MMEVEDCLLAEDSEEHEDGGEHGDISVDLEAPVVFPIETIELTCMQKY